MAFLAGFDIRYSSLGDVVPFFFSFFSFLLSLLFLEAEPKFNCISSQIMRIEVRDHFEIPALLALCDLTIETELSIIEPKRQSSDLAHMPRCEISGLPRRIDPEQKEIYNVHEHAA